MFWGLTIEPKGRFKHVVEKGFHISMAALDIFSCGNEPTRLFFRHGGHNHLLCTLEKENNVQVKLDLNFVKGEQVHLATDGNARVYLTGYFLNGSLLDYQESNESDDDKTEKVEIERKETEEEMEEEEENESSLSELGVNAVNVPTSISLTCKFIFTSTSTFLR